MSKTKTVLITGTTSGIGHEFAEIFADEGYNLVLVSRDKSKLLLQKRKYEAMGLEVVSIATDLSVPGAADKVFKALKGKQIHFLVNNAGFGDMHRFVDADWKKLESMMQLNMMTLTKLTYLFLPAMIKRKEGRILNVASTAAFIPGPMMAVYFATKAYVNSFSQAVAREVLGTNVTITSLCPGPTSSKFQKTANMADSKMIKGKKIPTSREVAEYGYDAMMSGKLVAIHGFGNKLMAGLASIAPRKMILDSVYSMQKK